jgi:hypothetical protein
MSTTRLKDTALWWQTKESVPHYTGLVQHLGAPVMIFNYVFPTSGC